MKFHIESMGVKRTVEGPFAICGSRADLETLVRCVTRELAKSELTYGWIHITELPITKSNNPPMSWFAGVEPPRDGAEK